MFARTSGQAGARRGALRRRASLTAATVGFLALIAAGPAAAQFFDQPPEQIPGLSPNTVRRMMVERGFRVLTPPFRRGDVFVVDAVDDRDGRQIRIIVGAYQGRILQTFAIGRPRLPVAPGRPVAADDGRLPFPGESADDGPVRRGYRDDDDRGRRGDGSGLFGLFARPDAPDRAEPRDPSVVPGVGPQDPQRSHRVARPKPAAPPKSVARSIPPALPGPKTIPATADAKAVDDVRPAPAPAIAPPAPKPPPAPPAEVRREPPPAAPAPVAKREVPPASETGPKARPVDIGPQVRPVQRAAPASPKPVETQAATTQKSGGDAATPKPAPRKRSGPLNDIPPAPLD